MVLILARLDIVLVSVGAVLTKILLDITDCRVKYCGKDLTVLLLILFLFEKLLDEENTTRHKIQKTH